MKTYALGAGFFCISLAIFVQGLLPIAIPESRETRATRAVRTELGEIKWVWYESSPYTPLEQLGRGVYQREGCWYCHSQFVRPVAGEDQRWGPVAEVGEYAYDWPHLLSTRRIGPDLSRVGLKFSDHWHFAHHWEPRTLVPDSVMPELPLALPHGPGRRSSSATAPPRSAESAGAQGAVQLQAGADDPALPEPGGPRLRRASPTARPCSTIEQPARAVRQAGDVEGQDPHRDRADRGAARAGGLHPEARHQPRCVARGVRAPGALGQRDDAARDRGSRWRAARPSTSAAASAATAPRATATARPPPSSIPGPATSRLGSFKFRTTPSGSLPTDGDLYRTLTRGVRWTAMPTWHELPEKDRIAVIAYIKTFSPRWKEEKPEPPIPIGDPPAADARSCWPAARTLYAQAKCFQCHGESGKGDGPSAGELQDDLKFPIRPADFTRGQFKGGGDVSDIYRTMTTGLDGTPMPSFADSMKEDERWAISYYVLSFSAFNDPLTGEKLKLDPATRARLNAPGRRGARHAPAGARPAAPPAPRERRSRWSASTRASRGGTLAMPELSTCSSASSWCPLHGARRALPVPVGGGGRASSATSSP